MSEETLFIIYLAWIPFCAMLGAAYSSAKGESVDDAIDWTFTGLFFGMLSPVIVITSPVIAAFFIGRYLGRRWL